MLRQHLLFLFLFFCFAFGAFGQANFSFSLNPPTGCTPVTVTFIDSSTGATFWNWNFGDGNSSTLENPSHTYGVAGTYFITLTINHGTDSITKQIIVHGSPTASFTLSSTLLCTGALLTIYNTSTAGSGPIDTVIWDFGDGYSPKTGFLDSLSHAYANAGSYAVNIFVKDTFGCYSPSGGELIHVKGPLAKFTASPKASCQPSTTVNFTNTTTDTTSSTTYLWNFGDPSSGTNDTSSQFNPSHTFSANNNYTVTLTALDSGCTSTYTFIYSQQVLSPVITSADTVCAGTAIFFSDTLTAPTPSKHHWNFGDPISGALDTYSLPTVSHVYNIPGTYNVSLTDTVDSSCAKTIVKSIYVRALPQVTFKASDSTFCKVPDTVGFTPQSGSGIKSWMWNFGDNLSGNLDTSSLQNPSHIYNNFGTYTVSLTVTDSFGCSFHYVKFNYIRIQAPLVAILLPVLDSGCVGSTFTFNAASSIVQGDSIVDYHWNFGDGSAAVDSAPPVSHTYNSCGIYNVTLTITTAKGCTATDTKLGGARVGIKPTANFIPDSAVVCYNAPLQFRDTSTANGCPITAWNWSFGAIGPDPQYLYTDTGKYDVTEIVFSNGCSDTLTRDTMVTVHPPKAAFDFSYRCDSPYVVIFHNLSHGADSLIWIWGDGSSNDTNALNPTHTFPSVTGTYTVTLSTSNNQYGCHDDTVAYVQITKPIARITANDSVGCHPLIVSFTGGTSQDAISYSWNFGDPSSGGNNVSFSVAPNHRFNSSGYYTVQLVITDIHGCHDTTTRIMQATGPTAGFTVDHLEGCAPLTVAFTDASDTAGAAIIQHHWYFNYPKLPADRVDTTANTFSHTFTQTGVYNILYVVTDANGCVDSILKNAYIIATHPKPFFPDSLFLCPGNLDSFQVNVGIQTYPKYNVIWNFGDGTAVDTVANDSTITHAYAANGIFNLTITVSDSNGFGCDSIRTCKIYSFKPTAHFTTSNIQDYCGYTQLTLVADSNNYTDQWAFTVNGPYGLVKNNTSPFNDTFFVSLNYPGVWTANLLVTNIGGCTAQIDTPLYIVQGPQGSFTFTPDSNCSPLTVTFHVDSAQNSSYIRYDFGDGSQSLVPPTDTVVSHTYYGNNGDFWIPHVYLGFTLDSTISCRVTLLNLNNPASDSIVKISGSPSVTITEDSILILEGQKDTLTAVPYNNSWSYHWYVVPGGETVPNLVPPTNAVYTAKEGDSLVVLVAKDAHGCEAYDTVRIIIIPCEANLKIPNVFTPNGDSLNDTYYIKNLCPITDFLITIYNRWGNVVYKSNDYNFHWDGRDDNGKECSDGVYYYIIHGKKSKLYGYIDLIRGK